MGMRVESSGGASQSASAAWQQRRQDFQQLSQALQSGNLSGAQSAFAALSAGRSSQAASNPNSLFSQLGQALQGGNLAAAQQAFAQIQQRRHGEHEQAPPAQTPASSTSAGLLNVVA